MCEIYSTSTIKILEWLPLRILLWLDFTCFFSVSIAYFERVEKQKTFIRSEKNSIVRAFLNIKHLITAVCSEISFSKTLHPEAIS